VVDENLRNEAFGLFQVHFLGNGGVYGLDLPPKAARLTPFLEIIVPYYIMVLFGPVVEFDSGLGCRSSP
jgi:hypothetical protein